MPKRSKMHIWYFLWTSLWSCFVRHPRLLAFDTKLGYCQIRSTECHKKETAFSSHYGLYRLLQMPFPQKTSEARSHKGQTANFWECRCLSTRTRSLSSQDLPKVVLKHIETNVGILSQHGVSLKMWMFFSFDGPNCLPGHTCSLADLQCWRNQPMQYTYYSIPQTLLNYKASSLLEMHLGRV